MTTLPLWTIKVRSSQYFPTGTTQPKYAIGQLIKTNIDGYSNSVDVCCIQGVVNVDGEWTYCCEFLARLQPGEGAPEWEAGERDWVSEIDLDPLTSTEEEKLYLESFDLCMQ